MDLEDLRREIDEIDNELLALFLRRMRIVEKVARYKIENNLPVFHPHREEEILNRREQQAGREMGPAVRSFFSALLRISKDMQNRLINLKK